MGNSENFCLLKSPGLIDRKSLTLRCVTFIVCLDIGCISTQTNQGEGRLYYLSTSPFWPKICSRIEIGLSSRTFSSAPSTTPISSLCIQVFSHLFLFPSKLLVGGVPSFDIISATSWRFGIFKQTGDLGKVLKKKQRNVKSNPALLCFFLFTSSCDWPENSRHFPNQSDTKLNQ